jgi:predicted Zn-dependent protease
MKRETIYGISFLLNLVFGSAALQWQRLAGDLFSTAGLLAYGRTAEYEADKSAVRISRAAGYDPNDYLGSLKKPQAIKWTRPNLLTELFSTHPETSGRIATVQREIATLAPPTKKLIKNTVQFNRIRKRIR